MAETSRDVLAQILRQAESAGFSPSYTPDRIRAAIAADDAEWERLRRIEDAAREVAVSYSALIDVGVAIPEWEALRLSMSALRAIIAEHDAEHDHA